MHVLKFYSYLFYRIKIYYNETWQAVFAFNTIILLNVMSCFMIYSSIMHYSIQEVWFLHFTNDYFYDRLVLGILKVSPIFIVTFLLSVIFRQRIQAYNEIFKHEPNAKQKKRSAGMIGYFIFTALFFLFGIVSSSFF